MLFADKPVFPLGCHPRYVHCVFVRTSAMLAVESCQLKVKAVPGYDIVSPGASMIFAVVLVLS